MLIAPFRQRFRRRNDFTAFFAAGNRIRRWRAHHHAFHDGLTADNQVALHRRQDLQKTDFSFVSVLFHSRLIDGLFVFRVALHFAVVVLYKTEMTVAFQTRLFDIAQVFDALLAHRAHHFVVSYHFALHILPQ